VLVVDDEPYVRRSLCDVLAAEGLSVLGAGGVPEAVAELRRASVDVVVSDLSMPGGDVFELLGHPATGSVPVIVITGVGTVSAAVRAMKAGAFDFVQKPVDPEQLLLLVARAHEHRRLRGELLELRDTVQRLRAPRVLVGGSEALAQVRERIAQVAPTDAPVLITGESGTGKQLAAEEIHAQSPRRARPLVRAHGAAVAGDSLLAELAGGGPAATRGVTLLLDEVGLLPPEGQASLLRVLDAPAAGEEAGAPRVLATSNADLSEAVRAGTFRADLYWRLNVFHLELPPLREHKEDLPELVEHFLAWGRSVQPARAGLPALPGPTREALAVMASYSWPGNVRELRNMLERAVIVAGGRAIDVALLRDILEPALSSPIASGGPETLHLRPNLDAAERELVLRALERSEGVRKRAAHLLGIDARNLGYYLRKHGLQ